ncbi:MAG TPA: ribonuclease P protein component [Cryomorphaceae bacterium]|nr:ribonuclease P protein component [Cryomorphaceae bacterium]
MSYRFSKAEKICSKYEIDALFEKGKNLRAGSLGVKVLWQETQDWPPLKFLVVVPKRRVKKAVDRNRLKRQLREIIRLNKKVIENEVAKANKRLLIAVIYNGQPKSNYSQLQSSFVRLVNQMPEVINKI